MSIGVQNTCMYEYIYMGRWDQEVGAKRNKSLQDSIVRPSSIDSETLE